MYSTPGVNTFVLGIDHLVASSTGLLPSSSYGASKVVFVETETHGSTTAKTHTVYATYVENDETKKEALFEVRETATLEKIENGVLFYTADGITYTVDLGATEKVHNIYAKDKGNFSLTGWAQPDVVGKYTFALGINLVTVVSYDNQTQENSAVTDITLFDEAEEDVE